MVERIPEALRRIIAEQYGSDDLDKILAQVFQLGALVVFHQNGAKEVLLETVLDIEVGDDPADEDLTQLETPAGEWNRLFHRRPKQTEIAVFPGNFREGTQGKHDKNTWRRDDFTIDDAPVRKGHEGRGHRGGMRHANSRPVLLKLLRQTPETRKYR